QSLRSYPSKRVNTATAGAARSTGSRKATVHHRSPPQGDQERCFVTSLGAAQQQTESPFFLDYLEWQHSTGPDRGSADPNAFDHAKFMNMFRHDRTAAAADSKTDQSLPYSVNNDTD